MKTANTVLIRVLLAIVLLALLIPATAAAQGPSERVIVTFAPGQDAQVKSAVAALGAHAESDLPLVHAAAFTLPPGLSMDRLREMPGVVRVEEDAIVTVAKKPPKPTTTTTSGSTTTTVPTSTQELPWGVERIQAPSAWAATTGDPIKVAVIDTGIDTSHPDLMGNLKGGYSAVSYTRSYNDDNGHGTHVAGIIAALDNAIGVVGVGPKADIYAVKVLNRSGSGYVSDIIKGITWAMNNGADVINMSLGTSTYVATFDAACQQAISAGVTIVAAAGNSGPSDNTVIYPAKFAGVIGVSATDSSNVLASFSSRGDGVDIAAPGVSIYSTYKGQTYATLSGTSMASPHVAGVAALVLTTPVGSDDANGNGKWDPAEVQNRLTRTAEDLGASGYDTLYGWGLARADLAVAAQ